MQTQVGVSACGARRRAGSALVRCPVSAWHCPWTLCLPQIQETVPCSRVSGASVWGASGSAGAPCRRRAVLRAAQHLRDQQRACNARAPRAAGSDMPKLHRLPNIDARGPMTSARRGSCGAGITLSPKQVERAGQLAAARGLANVDFRVMNALAMDFPDDSFDLVWACESGEHMPDKKAYVEEMVRVLKPGARPPDPYPAPARCALPPRPRRPCRLLRSRAWDLRSAPDRALPNGSSACAVRARAQAHAWGMRRAETSGVRRTARSRTGVS